MSERKLTKLEKLLINLWLNVSPRTLTVDGDGRGSTHGGSSSTANGTGLRRQEAAPRDLDDQSRLAPTPPPDNAFIVKPEGEQIN
jgi:hypothetical protein